MRRITGEEHEVLACRAVNGERNDNASGSADISAPATTVGALVVNAREDIQIAHESRRVLDRR